MQKHELNMSTLAQHENEGLVCVCVYVSVNKSLLFVQFQTRWLRKFVSIHAYLDICSRGSTVCYTVATSALYRGMYTHTCLVATTYTSSS